MSKNLTNDFKSIVLNSNPLIDLRAPIEYIGGSFLNSVNLPLLFNKERELIGTIYKEQGNEAAVEMGHKIVSVCVKEERLRGWIDFIKSNQDTIIFCWRGGQRSGIVQQWLKENGVNTPRIEGGYKAFRRYLIDEPLNIIKSKRVVTIGGRTGSGKTILLKKLNSAIDLEGLANHRGSAFGGHLLPQPTQIEFENNLAYAIIKEHKRDSTKIVIEDESRNIGARYIPDLIFKEFQTKGELILLDTQLEQRVDIIFNEYVVASQLEHKDAGENSWIDSMRENFSKIERRVGGLRYKELLELLNSAYKEQLSQNSTQSHKEWINYLLTNYYDSMYDYQIKAKDDKIIFRGNMSEIEHFLEAL